MNTRPNIVLIHGAWAEGSCWSGVIERLQADGYHVTAPQFPLTALADDVARLRQVLDRQDGPAIVAGHSSSPPGWAPPPSRSRPATSRWSPTPVRWPG